MEQYPIQNEPHPMPSDSEFTRKLEEEEEISEEGIKQLEREFGFKYRSAMGEITFTMVTIIIDISYQSTKLSQYNHKPCRKHFEAVKNLLLYLRDTIDEGIYFWRSTPNMLLPTSTIPNIRQDPYERK